MLVSNEMRFRWFECRSRNVLLLDIDMKLLPEGEGRDKS